MNYKFLRNERAMIVDDFLIIADLHIGYKKTLEAKGYSIPSQAKFFSEKIKEISKKEKVNQVIILGDIKHKIPRVAHEEKYDVPNFLYELSKTFKKIIIVKGNHDGRIEFMAHQKNVEVVSEYIVGKIGFIHGHRWPTKELMKEVETIIMGHSHPIFKIKDSMGYKHFYPCWTVCAVKKKGFEKYKENNVKKVIIMPPFNPLLNGIEKLTGPLSKSLIKKEIFLLDLTKVK